MKTDLNNSITEPRWQSLKDGLPPEGKKVYTKIDDKDGVRNETILIRKGKAFFFSDMSMYVYYMPTHWAQKI